MIDSRSVKTTEDGGVCGHDAGKKIAGRKRHVITDTPGRMLFIIVHSAAIQDREGLPILMKAMRYRSPWPRHPFADGGHAGDKLKDALSGHGQWIIEIIQEQQDPHHAY